MLKIKKIRWWEWRENVESQGYDIKDEKYNFDKEKYDIDYEGYDVETGV